MVAAAALGATPWCTRLISNDEVTVAENNLRELVAARVDTLLQDVRLPVPWNIDTFIDRLERARGREIDLCEVTWSLGESTGAWQARPDRDVIAYATNTSALHQDHVILHEIGHMLQGHRGQCVLSVSEAQRRAPDLTLTALTHLLDRVTVGGEEREAELFALLLQARIAKQDRSRAARRPADRRTAATLERVAATFGDL